MLRKHVSFSNVCVVINMQQLLDEFLDNPLHLAVASFYGYIILK